MKTVTLKTKFDEIRAINWRMKPLEALGRVVVYEPATWGQQSTTLIIYEDGTVYCSAVAKNHAMYDQVSVYPHDTEFAGLFWCLVKAGLIDKTMAKLIMGAARGMNSNTHPGWHVNDHMVKQFEGYIEKYGSPSGMRRAKRAFDRMVAKDVDKAIADANADYAQRKEAATRKAEKAAKTAEKKKPAVTATKRKVVNS